MYLWQEFCEERNDSITKQHKHYIDHNQDGRQSCWLAATILLT